MPDWRDANQKKLKIHSFLVQFVGFITLPARMNYSNGYSSGYPNAAFHQWTSMEIYPGESGKATKFGYIPQEKLPECTPSHGSTGQYRPYPGQQVGTLHTNTIPIPSMFIAADSAVLKRLRGVNAAQQKTIKVFSPPRFGSNPKKVLYKKIVQGFYWSI